MHARPAMLRCVVMRALWLVLAGALANVSWATYGFSYANTRHAPLQQINAVNVAQLISVWRFVLGPHERVETTPIVVGRTMYVTTGIGNTVVALDAVSGTLKWRYAPTLGRMAPCCGALNRGVAVWSNRVFLATMDARLIALNARTGRPVWSVQIDDPVKGFSETMAPLAWNGTVFIGSSGGDYSIRGSITAYAAADGKRLWRWYAVSAGWEGAYVPSVHGFSLHRDVAREKRDDRKYHGAWMHGGGAVWMTPALDPRTATIFASTGNPSPAFDAGTRPGDNLYTDSIVAVDARTGKMRWYYQQTPHDVWEYEAASPPILFDVRDNRGNPVPAVGEAGKTRWLYVLRRSDGKLLRLSQNFVPNANVYNPPPGGTDNAFKPQIQLRGTLGPIAYDPATHLAFVTSIDRPSANVWQDVMVAVNVDTGAIAWKYAIGEPHTGIRGDPVLAGALSAGDLVFVCDTEGRLFAFRSSNGDLRWKYQLGATSPDDANAGPFQRFLHRVHDWFVPMKRQLMHQPPPTRAASADGNPIAYRIDGREYIAVGYDDLPDRAIGGAAIAVFALPRGFGR